MALTVTTIRAAKPEATLKLPRQVRSFASRAFRYGVATTRCKRDIAADLIGALTAPTVTHHAAIVEPVKVGALLRSIDGYDGHVSLSQLTDAGARSARSTVWIAY